MEKRDGEEDEEEDGAAGQRGDGAAAGPKSTGGGDSRARDHLANERTLLAWGRTSIAVIGLGFIVARFGLLIRELGHNAPRLAPLGISTTIGTVLVLCGSILTALALLRYLRTGRGIERGQYRWSPTLGITLAALLTLAGLLLAIYLVITG